MTAFVENCRLKCERIVRLGLVPAAHQNRPFLKRIIDVTPHNIDLRRVSLIDVIKPSLKGESNTQHRIAVLKALHRNINQYPRSGVAPIKAIRPSDPAAQPTPGAPSTAGRSGRKPESEPKAATSNSGCGCSWCRTSRSSSCV